MWEYIHNICTVQVIIFIINLSQYQVPLTATVALCHYYYSAQPTLFARSRAQPGGVVLELYEFTQAGVDINIVDTTNLFSR